MPLVALLRHGEEEGAADGRGGLESRSPRGLSATGRAQAEAAREFLTSLDAPRVASSDRPRAIETARIVAAGRPVDIVPALGGMDLGEWEGRPASQLPELGRVLSDPALRPPGGESLTDLAARFRVAVMGVLPPEGDAIVVAHRMTNAVLLAELLGLPPQDACLIQQDPGGITILARRGEELRVQMLNLSPLDPLRTRAVTSRG